MCGRAPPSELHHSTARRGLGQRSSDHDGIPLCMLCHHEFHSACGAFRDMDKAARRKWQEDAVAKYQDYRWTDAIDDVF